MNKAPIGNVLGKEESIQGGFRVDGRVSGAPNFVKGDGGKHFQVVMGGGRDVKGGR